MEILQWSNYCSQRLVLSLSSLSSSLSSSFSSLSLLSLLDFPEKQVPIEKLLSEKKEGFDCTEPVADSSNNISSVKKTKVKVPINDEGNNSPRVQLKSSPTPLKSTKQSSTPTKASQVIDLSLDD